MKRRRYIAAVLPVVLFCCWSTAAGATEDTAPGTTLIAHGIVEGTDVNGTLVSFQLYDEDLRFAVEATSPTERSAIIAALTASEQSSRSVAVHFELAGARFAPDRSLVVFPVRSIEYDGKRFAERDAAAQPPIPNGAVPATDAAFINGVGLFYGGRYSAAAAEFDAALTGNDADWKTLAHKLRALALTNDVYTGYAGPTDAGDRALIKALQDLREWQSAKPEDPRPMYKLAEALRELGAYPEALELYAAIARRWHGEAIWPAIRTGATERELHHYPEALAALDKLVTERGPQEGMAYHYHRGWILIELGRYAEAVDEFTQGLRSQPDYMWALIRRSCAEDLLGRADAALADQQAAVLLLQRSVEGSKAAEYNLRRAAEVESALRLARQPRSPADAKALCGGYWRAEDGRVRSTSLAADLPWVGAIVGAAHSSESLPKYKVGPPAEWVRPLPAPAAPSARTTPASISREYLLVDRQIHLDGARSYYSRTVVRPLNPAGVSEESQLSILFDPQRENLRVHAVTVSRGSETIDELKRGRIEVLQRESSLEKGLLDGSLTFHLVMADVRVGDTIEYSYTLEQTDSQWGQRFFAWYQTNWDEPVAVSHIRVQVRAGQPLAFTDHGGVAARTTVDGDWRTLEWDWRNLPASASESGTPGWYRRHGRIEFSQFADWHEVINAVWPLYMNNAPTPELTALIARFRSQGHSDRERLVAIMRFVQDEIRYTGVEIGDGAYQPADSATVLQRRWGDCKDKTQLAVTLLRGVGIEADPALVNTRLGAHVSELLPSPGAFDHAIVRARVGKVSYWIDSTATGQGGDLDRLAQARFGAALVVRADSAALEAIPADATAEPITMSTVTVDLRRGFDKPARLAVTTTHRGSDADGLRRTLRETTAQELGTNYLNYYKKRYAGIRAMGPVQIHDDRTSNEVRIDESYEIDGPLELNKEGTTRELLLEADSLTPFLKAPETPVRTTPLEVAFPINVAQLIRIELPEALPVDDDRQRLETPAFRYESRLSHSKTEMVAEYHYQTLADHVTVEQLPEFLKKREAARNDCFLNVRVAVETEPSKGPGAAAAQQLAAAAQLAQAESWEKADAAFTSLLGSGGFAELGETKQHAALYLAGIAALVADDAARAQKLLKRASAMAAADFADWEMRLRAALAAKDGPDAAYTLTRIARNWPDTVSDLEPREVFGTVAKVPHLDASRYELLKALFDAKFKRPGVDPSHWWRDLALMQIERSDRGGALASVSALTDAYAIIGVLADDRFKGIRESLPAPLDVAEALRRQADVDRKAMADNPSKLEPVNALAHDLLAALRTEEALKLLESTIELAKAPDGKKKYKDYDRQYPWLLDTRSRALFSLGRWDEALAQLQAAARLREHGSVNVSQTINLAELYNRLQRPNEARAALGQLEEGSMSPFGEMQQADARLSAALQLGDAAESTRLLDYLREHREDAIETYEGALIMADRLDEAAALLIARLQNPDQRIGALMAVQHYPSVPPDELPRARELRRRWAQVTERADVRAEIAKVGNVGTYPVLEPGAD